jgi:hypothetical protein
MPRFRLRPGRGRRLPSRPARGELAALVDRKVGADVTTGVEDGAAPVDPCM